jgi:hypothetical protein
MKLLFDDYNIKEKAQYDVGLVEQKRNEWIVNQLGNEKLVRKVCLVVVDQRLTHPD